MREWWFNAMSATRAVFTANNMYDADYINNNPTNTNNNDCDINNDNKNEDNNMKMIILI